MKSFMFLSSGFIWPSFFAVCGFDPNMTQISQYSIKLTASLTVELLPVLRTLPVHFFYFHSSVFTPLEFQSNRSSSRLFLFCHLPVQNISVNLLHLPDDLLLEDGQDGVIVTHLLEHDPAVKLVAHFLEVEPAGQTQMWRSQSQTKTQRFR